MLPPAPFQSTSSNPTADWGLEPFLVWKLKSTCQAMRVIVVSLDSVIPFLGRFKCLQRCLEIACYFFLKIHMEAPFYPTLDWYGIDTCVKKALVGLDSMKWYASAVYIYPLNLVLHERWVEEKISFFFGFLSNFSARSNMIGLEDRRVESTVFLDMAKINLRIDGQGIKSRYKIMQLPWRIRFWDCPGYKSRFVTDIKMCLPAIWFPRDGGQTCSYGRTTHCSDGKTTECEP